MTHTTLKVFVTAYASEPGGTLSVMQRRNQDSSDELKTHIFPAGVVKDFATLHDSARRLVFIRVLRTYVERHGLARLFS